MFRITLCLLLTGLTLGSDDLLAQQPQDDKPADSPFLVEPTTPEDLFEAARTTTRLARTELARQYLSKILQADDATILAIREKYGAGELLRLAAIRSLHPESRTLLKRANDAFRGRTESPAYIDELIRGLSGTARDRETAISTLRAGGSTMVGPLLNVMADAGRVGEHEAVSLALMRMVDHALPGLKAGARAANLNARSAALTALGYAKDRSVAAYLWHPAFAPGQPTGVRHAARSSLQRLLAGARDVPSRIDNFGAAEQLYQTALGHFGGSAEWETDENGQVAVWTWVENKLTRTQVSARSASGEAGLHFAKDAMELAPQETKYQTLYLAFALSRDSRQVGWNKPLPTGRGTAQDLGLSVGGDLLGGALGLALDHNNIDAARGALSAIWQVGDSSVLRSEAGGPSPLFVAMKHRDARVRFSAVNAILSLNPPPNLPGSSQVVHELTRALNSDSIAHCLVIDPNATHAVTMAGLLKDLGYDARTASRGREGFRLAADHGDTNLVAIQYNASEWGLRQTVANFRADARTAGIPIVVYGPAGAKSLVNDVLSQYRDVTFLEESEVGGGDAAQKFVSLSLKPFLEATTPRLSAEEIARRKLVAADWFAQLAGPRRQSGFDFSGAEAALVAGVRNPKIARKCVIGLAAIPTGAVQTSLQQMAVDETIQAESRESVMNELTYHIQRNGMMLETRRQLEIVRMAETVQDGPLSTAAAALVGVMRPGIRTTFERLRRYRPKQ